MPRARERFPISASANKSPVKIPLNDDRREKASRFQSRQALHERQMNEIKAAASTPQRRSRPIGNDSPLGKENESDPIFGNNANTPLKRVPLLANFEEWMRMATDNKINANNSWNFALIDYFHDMSLLKEGDGVNFQKASCTLDGCVKIYTSRVDSVATETGKLLSGLADSRNKNKATDDEGEGDDGQESGNEDGEDGKKRQKKKTQRSSEATLASSFTQLQLKKMELEFSVDPLFKKASADFDEGGAKGLLLNNLTIDAQGKIVFDSSDDAQDASAEEQHATTAPDARIEADHDQKTEDSDIDIDALSTKFFPDLARLDEQDICPSLKDIDFSDPDGSLELPFLKTSDDALRNRKSSNPEDDRQDVANGADIMPFNDDGDDGGFGGFDLPLDTGFGEGGEVWANHAALNPQMRVHTIGEDNLNPNDLGDEDGMFQAGQDTFAIALSQRVGFDTENILNYFDKSLEKNWAGPEHWKIKKIKENSKAAVQPSMKRKEKEPFEINFAAPLTQVLADALYVPASSNSTISLPKPQWTSKTRNLLPDDKHFSSRQLLRLFLKPRARIGGHKANGKLRETIEGAGEEEANEEFWARNRPADTPESLDDQTARPDYDANFFQDDGLSPPDDIDDHDDFADAREVLSTPNEQELASQGGAQPAGAEGAFGAQLVTQSRRVRPEYVQYARVAKKVDVRRLKEEMWRGTGFESSIPNELEVETTTKEPSVEPRKFSNLINNLQTVYPPQLMADISTSYCFICLLHLANEKGLILNHDQDFQELTIQKDFSAEVNDVSV